MITTFPAARLQRLRRQAAPARLDPPKGWSKSIVDPMTVVAVFKSLRIKEGFVLRAYQFRAGGDGNGFVWAMPEDAPFPEPDECPRLEGGFLHPPKPPGALADAMRAIEGDGTPWSYLCASLFSREIREFGAMWHGSDWNTHTILDRDPLAAGVAGRRQRDDRPSGAPELWTWFESKPAEWKPHVVQDGAAVTVVFHSFSGHIRQAIVRHVDTFRRASYCFKTTAKRIATGPGGYIF